MKSKKQSTKKNAKTNEKREENLPLLPVSVPVSVQVPVTDSLPFYKKKTRRKSEESDEEYEEFLESSQVSSQGNGNDVEAICEADFAFDVPKLLEKDVMIKPVTVKQKLGSIGPIAHKFFEQAFSLPKKKRIFRLCSETEEGVYRNLLELLNNDGLSVTAEQVERLKKDIEHKIDIEKSRVGKLPAENEEDLIQNFNQDFNFHQAWAIAVAESLDVNVFVLISIFHVDTFFNPENIRLQTNRSFTLDFGIVNTYQAHRKSIFVHHFFRSVLHKKMTASAVVEMPDMDYRDTALELMCIYDIHTQEAEACFKQDEYDLTQVIKQKNVVLHEETITVSHNV